MQKTKVVIKLTKKITKTRLNVENTSQDYYVIFKLFKIVLCSSCLFQIHCSNLCWIVFSSFKLHPFPTILDTILVGFKNPRTRLASFFTICRGIAGEYRTWICFIFCFGSPHSSWWTGKDFTNTFLLCVLVLGWVLYTASFCHLAREMAC